MNERGEWRMHKWGDSHVRDTNRLPLVVRLLYGFIEEGVLCCVVSRLGSLEALDAGRLGAETR